MRTIRGASVLLALAASMVAGCTKHAACNDGTIFVDVTFVGAAVQASQLILTVEVVGQTTPSPIPVSHVAGQTSGGLVINFPHGYPVGQTVNITVGVDVNGVLVSTTNSFSPLPAGCVASALTVGAVDDLSAPTDLSKTDLSNPGDLAGDMTRPVDLSTLSDLSRPPDLARAPDLITCTPTTEKCFDGIDNDCDGLVDCADTGDCPSTVAMCVPQVANAEYGAAFGGATLPSCASGSTAHTLIGNVPSGSFNCQGCASSVSGTPSVAILSDATSSCGVTNQSADRGTISTSCSALSLPLSYQWGTDAYTGITCSAPSAPSVPPATLRDDEFCQDSAVGGGCSSGKVCVPAVTKACVQVASTVSCASTTSYTKAYVPDSGSWYLGKTDTRQCNGTCSTPTGSPLTVRAYSDSGCSIVAASGSASSTASGYDGCVTPGSYYFKLDASTLYCPSSLAGTGSITGTNPVNVCCLP